MKYFWWFGFTIIFLLSLDFWAWHSDGSLSWLNFPNWVFYFFGLQIILSMALLFFSLTTWRTLD